MLSRLNISNFALIREMEVEFPGNLTVITGETGAGKSIFLEALGLALGKRADLSVLGNKEKKCVVEAEFVSAKPQLRELFVFHELDPDDRVVLRREISAEGRSRSFINDALVPLAVVREFADLLVDIHSQHQTLLLNGGSFQLGLLDAFAGSREMFVDYRDIYRQLQNSRKQLAGLIEKEAVSRKELDYYHFMFDELSQAGLEPGKLAAMTEEARLMENTEQIRSQLLRSAEQIGEGDANVLSTLAQVRQSLSATASFGTRYWQLAERLNSVYIELKDIYGELDDAGNSLMFDEGRLNLLNEKLDEINRLMKKHNVREEQELLLVREQIGKKLDEFMSLEDQVAAARKDVLSLEKNCRAAAQALSKKRTAAVPVIERQTKSLLSELAMPNAQLRVNMYCLDEPGVNGLDEVSFLFTANKGDEPAEISKVASGGELSRLMLCLKSLLAEKQKLPTIIFDEIDTGVSGEVGAKIGAILEKMSASLQVITITHLPQMASRGEHHLFVFKKDEKERTSSYIRLLEGDERVKEIAKMLSAGKPGESALQNARELLSA